MVGPPLPDTIHVCPYTTGVMPLVLFALTKERSHNNAPVDGIDADAPCLAVIVTSCRVPPSSVMIGEP